MNMDGITGVIYAKKDDLDIQAADPYTKKALH